MPVFFLIFCFYLISNRFLLISDLRNDGSRSEDLFDRLKREDEDSRRDLKDSDFGKKRY